jgi:hypothetical protein
LLTTFTTLQITKKLSGHNFFHGSHEG